MVVSFKVSKTGTRFRPKPKPLPLQPSQDHQSQSDVVEAGDNIGQKPKSSENLPLIADKEASFTLNLYSAGYSIGKPGKYDAANKSPKFLLPYDRSSETLFSAIESGHLPGDILDDIPAKYVDGALICEVRDYRRCSSEKGAGIVSVQSSPTVNKVCLKMSLENIVKDIPSLTDKSWTYGNIMEVESKILKALQPNLHLDPTPNMDRLCESPLPTKLNLQRKRLRNIPEFAVTSINKIRGKKVYIDRVQKNSNSRLGDSRITTSNAIVKQTVENPAMQNLNPSIAKRSKNIVPDSSIPGFSMMSHQSKYPIAVGTPRRLQEHGSISGINSSGASAAQDVMILYADNPNMSVSLHVKRDNPDGQSSPLSNIAKRMRLASTGVASTGVKRLQQRMPQHAFTRPNVPQSTWNSLGQDIKKEEKKEDQLQKRKHLQSPRLSHGTLPHSPLSSKSGKTSNGSVRPSFGPFSMNTAPGALQKEKEAAPGALQKEKATMASHTTAVGTPSLTFSANDSTQRQQQAQLAAKQISNSLPKSPEMSVVQKFPKQIYEGGLNQQTRATQFASGQQGMRLVAKVEEFERKRTDGPGINRNKSELETDARNLDPQQLQLQQRMPQHAFTRPNFPQSTLNSLGKEIKKEAKKEDQLQKRKHVQSPRFSRGTLPHRPLSSESGEFSNDSVGPSFGPSSMNTASKALQKEKASMASHSAAPSLTFSANDSTQRQQQVHLAAKQISYSLPKSPEMSVVQKFPQHVYEGGINQETRAAQFASGQQGTRLVANVKQFEMERINGARINHNKSELEKDARNLDPHQLRLQQRMPQHAFMRPDFQYTTWNSPGHQIKKESNKEDQLRKRKQVQSPRLSSGTLPQLPLSSKSGEFNNGSVGPSFGPSSMNNASGALQKEKAAMASHTAVVGTPSLTCRANDSTQRQQQAYVAKKQRSNSLPKTAAMSGVASPASVSTVPFNTNSPSVGASDFSEQGLQNMLDRFLKVDMVTTRHKLHFKMKNPDLAIIKQNRYAPQRVAFHLANATNNEGLIDESSSLSKSLLVGSMNTCKMRVLSFIWNERVVEGNVVNLVPTFRTRMMMAENPSDGTVALHYGDIDDNDFIGAEEYLPTLSNTRFADLLADQYSSQIEDEGYVKEDDRIQLRPNVVNLPLGSQSSLPANEMQQYGEPIPGQSCNEAENPQALQMFEEFLSDVLIENPQALQMSEEFLSGVVIETPQALQMSQAFLSGVSIENPQALQMSQASFLSGTSIENPQALQMSQAFLSGVSMAQRSHQLGSQQQAVQQLQQNQHSLLQQQNPQFQRSLLGANQLSHLNGVGQNSNMPLGNHLFHHHGSTMGVPLLSQQTNQQTSPQQMSQQTPMSPQQMWSNYWLA